MYFVAEVPSMHVPVVVVYRHLCIFFFSFSVLIATFTFVNIREHS